MSWKGAPVAAASADTPRTDTHPQRHQRRHMRLHSPEKGRAIVLKQQQGNRARLVLVGLHAPELTRPADRAKKIAAPHSERSRAVVDRLRPAKRCTATGQSPT